MKRLTLLGLAVSISLSTTAFGTCTSPGVNLLTNCGFPSNVAGWTPEGGGSALFVHDPVQGNTLPGAAHVSADNSVGTSQCFSVLPGNYGFGMHGSNIAGNSSNVLICTVTVQGFSALGCGAGTAVGAALSHSAGFTNFTAGADWVTMNNTGTLLPTVQSALFRIACLAPGASLADAFFDDLFFGVGLTPVELLRFSVE